MSRTTLKLCLLFLLGWGSNLLAEGTTGFEVEFVGPLDHGAYPFLSPILELEESGNREVKSRVFTNDEEMLGALRTLVVRLGPQRRSIHVHRRLQKTSLKGGAVSAAGLASRLSDIVFLYRLEKAPKIATTYWSQERRSPSGITTAKGAVFLQDFGKEWDLEIRGVYDDPALAVMMSRAFPHFLNNGRGMRALLETQAALFQRTEGLGEALDRISIKNGLGPLDENQKKKISFFEQSVRYSALMPLYHYEEAPGLSTEESRRIEAANAHFFFRTLLLAKGPGPLDQALATRFRQSLSQWAKDSDLYRALVRDLERRVDHEVSHRDTNAFLAKRIRTAKTSSQTRIRSEAEALSQGGGMSEWLVNKVSDELNKTTPDAAILQRILASEGPDWNGLMERMLTHPDRRARLTGLKMLFSRSPAKIPLQLLHDVIHRETDPEVSREAVDLVGTLFRKGIRIQPARGYSVLPVVQNRNLQEVYRLNRNCGTNFSLVP